MIRCETSQQNKNLVRILIIRRKVFLSELLKKVKKKKFWVERKGTLVTLTPNRHTSSPSWRTDTPNRLYPPNNHIHSWITSHSIYGWTELFQVCRNIHPNLQNTRSSGDFGTLSGYEQTTSCNINNDVTTLQ